MIFSSAKKLDNFKQSNPPKLNYLKTKRLLSSATESDTQFRNVKQKKCDNTSESSMVKTLFLYLLALLLKTSNNKDLIFRIRITLLQMKMDTQKSIPMVLVHLMVLAKLKQVLEFGFQIIIHCK
jgi:hypothetical protein